MLQKCSIKYFLVIILSSVLLCMFGYQFYVKYEQKKIISIFNERLVLYDFLLSGELDRPKVLLATLLRGDMSYINDGHAKDIYMVKYGTCDKFSKKIEDNLINFYKEINSDIKFIRDFKNKCKQVNGSR